MVLRRLRLPSCLARHQASGPQFCTEDGYQAILFSTCFSYGAASKAASMLFIGRIFGCSQKLIPGIPAFHFRFFHFPFSNPAPLLHVSSKIRNSYRRNIISRYVATCSNGSACVGNEEASCWRGTPLNKAFGKQATYGKSESTDQMSYRMNISDF